MVRAAHGARSIMVVVSLARWRRWAEHHRSAVTGPCGRSGLLRSAPLCVMRPAVSTQRCCTFYRYTSLKGPCSPFWIPSHRLHRPSEAICFWRATCLRGILECYVTRIQQGLREISAANTCTSMITSSEVVLCIGGAKYIAQYRRPHLQLAVINLMKGRWVLD